jgi:hypothetical protein
VLPSGSVGAMPGLLQRLRRLLVVLDEPVAERLARRRAAVVRACSCARTV